MAAATSCEIALLHEKGWSRHFYIEIGSNAHEQCVTRCPVSRLVHSPGRPASAITWNPEIPASQYWDPS